MPLEIAEHAGFCMGVKRAVQAAMQVARSDEKACTLGELIHNPQVVAELAAQGVSPVHDIAEAKGYKVLIRSHGVDPETLEALKQNGCAVQDLTCPFVDKLHRIVAEGSKDGTPVILVGEKEHPEVRGTAGWAHGEVYAVNSVEEAESLPAMEKALAAAQTTFPPEKWEAIVSVLEKKIRSLDKHCTICSATETRQREAKELASRADAMIVIGGRNSANTKKLYAACKERCPRTILVERASEIPAGFANINIDIIGITAGASTPDGSLKEVVTHMTDTESMDFGALLAAEEQTKLRPGQQITGKVLTVSDDDVCVSIPGYKADGRIKRADLMQADVKVGDEIEAEVIKINDGEGDVVLSQRNIANRKAWDALMAKYDAGELVVEGVGKEAVKGGLIADVGGVRAFVPASQLSQRYVEKIGDFVGKDMKLKIIEVDKQKKRIVASRKAVVVEEAAAKKKEAWDKLEEGIVIHGIVRRLTDFGAFVDVGGVDGLIHITDLSWGRIKHPSEVVQPNQEVDVKILSLDRDRDRIQLGYKQLQARPWDNAQEKYPEGSIVEGKVVRITDFGAFVELESGLDGLVHISQCALNRVAKVEDAVQVGQTVRVKVLSVDPEKKRISLSIRQVLEEEAFNYSDEIPGDAEFELVATDETPVEDLPQAEAEDAPQA